MERDERQSACANGHTLDEYPETYNDAKRMGINFKGFVEYWDDDRVHSILYEVGSSSLTEFETHQALGMTPHQHVKATSDRFDDWWHVEQWVHK